jgi:hypothetical protein
MIEQYKGWTIEVSIDEDPQDPRDWQDSNTMVCFHNKYRLGDKHDLNMNDFDSWYEVKEHLIAECGAIAILPLYLYDHSGISMSVGSFEGRAPHASWDSGQVGFIYATDGDMVEYGHKTIEEAEDHLRNDVYVYDQYLRGEVYRFRIYKQEECDTCHAISNIDGDSNGGWENTADAITEAKSLIDWEVAQESKRVSA